MTLRIRHLRLRAITGAGRFGADIPMSSGLMIIRAENSRGKSTAVQSILFALGLERMITTRPTNALTAAMRDRLIFDAASMAETPVLSSWVEVEIQGVDGQVATVTRWVRDEKLSPSLVRVSFGQIDSDPGTTQSEDYYVGRSGGASNPRGFHSWLAEFIGWEMPMLPARDGRTAPLYIEQVFPLLFVEQRRGWGGIQAQMPYFSGVAEVRKRAIEFLLGLDVGKNELERQRLKNEEDELQTKWRSSVLGFVESIEGSGIRLVGVPEHLNVAWPPEGKDPYLAQAGDDDEWVPIEEVLPALLQEEAESDRLGVPPIERDTGGLSDELFAAFQQLNELRQDDAIVRENIIRDESELRSVVERLASLQEDLRQHQDVAVLESLGSPLTQRLHENCPVCHQTLPSSLLAADVPTMTPTESVAYIRQQIELFRAMERDSRNTVASKRERWIRLRERTAEVSGKVRALREAILTPAGTPSLAEVTNRVQRRERITHLQAAQERFFGLRGRLEELASLASEVRAALRLLPRDALTDLDKRKLRLLQESFISQLHDYEFGSFRDEALVISPEDYLPRRDEFDLQADISASDSIRVIWGYLLGLLEVGEKAETNHPGLLVFDEPRQQSAKDVSFEALLKRAAQNGSSRQVLFATSENLTNLKSMLVDLEFDLHIIDGYLLKPIA